MKTQLRNIRWLLPFFSLMLLLGGSLTAQVSKVEIKSNGSNTYDEDVWECVGKNCVLIKRGDSSSQSIFEIDLVNDFQNTTRPISLITNGKETLHLLAPTPGGTTPRFGVYAIQQTTENYRFWWKGKAKTAEMIPNIGNFCRERSDFQLFETEGSRTQIILATCYNNDGSPRARKIFIGELSIN